jgi:hypothetical protein
MIEAHYKDFDREHVPVYAFFIIILSGVRLSSLGTVATTGLLYQPQIMVIVVQLVEGRLVGET